MDAAAPPKVKFTSHRSEPREGKDFKRAGDQVLKEGGQRTFITLPAKPAPVPAALPAADQLIKEPPRRSITSLKAISDEDAEASGSKNMPGKPMPAGLKKKLGGWFKR